LNLKMLGLAFVLFRFFDIVKPLGIERLERIEGGWGIVLDDLAAAFFARFVLNIMFYIQLL
jgi:phosphatidylglycerophosphatase A